MEDWGFLLSSQLSPSISTCLKDNGFLVWCKMPLVIAGSMTIDYDYLGQRRHLSIRGELHAGAEVIISWESPCLSRQWWMDHHAALECRSWLIMETIPRTGLNCSLPQLLLCLSLQLILAPWIHTWGHWIHLFVPFIQCDINRISFLFFTIICLLIDGKDSGACAWPGFPAKSSGYTVIVECHFNGPISSWVCPLSFQALLHIVLWERFVLHWWHSPHFSNNAKNNVLPNLCILEPVVNH